jgi:hypothetical protein
MIAGTPEDRGPVAGVEMQLLLITAMVLFGWRLVIQRDLEGPNIGKPLAPVATIPVELFLAGLEPLPACGVDGVRAERRQRCNWLPDRGAITALELSEKDAG